MSRKKREIRDLIREFSWLDAKVVEMDPMQEFF